MTDNHMGAVNRIQVLHENKCSQLLSLLSELLLILVFWCPNQINHSFVFKCLLPASLIVAQWHTCGCAKHIPLSKKKTTVLCYMLTCHWLFQTHHCAKILFILFYLALQYFYQHYQSHYSRLLLSTPDNIAILASLDSPSFIILSSNQFALRSFCL